MKKNKLKIMAMAIATSCVLISCSGPIAQTPICELPEIKLTSNQSQKLNISVYVDGSGSMLGYIKPSNSAYIQALNVLGDTLELSEGLHSQNLLNYYRIGQSNPLINRSDYRKARLGLFYDGTDSQFPAVSSPIHDAVKEPSGDDDLIVIITDLEQDQGDVTKLTKNLKDNYFNKNKNYSVGIWAVKSEFDGRVYIENEQNNLISKEYSTDNKSKNEYRPFYILFVGRNQDIEYYFDKIKSTNAQLTDGEQGHLLMFNPHHLVSQLTSIKNLPELPQTITKPTTLSDGIIQIYQDNNNPYQLLKISGENENPQLKISLPLATLKYSLPLEPKTLTAINKVKKYDGYQTTENKFVEETETPSLKNALNFDSWNINPANSELEFNTTIKPEEINNNLVHLYDVDIKASNFMEPLWWKEWSWQSLEQQEGSKTQNLDRLLQQLKDISLELITDQDQNVSIGKLCFAIKKD
jgi:hypothetical protein